MRFALLAFLLPLTALSCGGSSSETPPPLEPDPTSARYSGPRVPRADDPQPAAAATPDDDDAEAQPRHPAKATWGK
ncbi:MAG TPA: hypothetical protein VNG33_01035 [Polyangiaceae bacterium]|nr:hypothetical protein [Polyangiaceae bacterium]